MNYVELEIGGNVYKLRLTTRACIQLEKVLGVNPLQILWDVDNGKLPKVNDLVATLHIMLQPLNHGITLDKAYDLFDEYLKDHNVFEIMPVFIEVFQAAGFIQKEQVEDNTQEEKN